MKSEPFPSKIGAATYALLYQLALLLLKAGIHPSKIIDQFKLAFVNASMDHFGNNGRPASISKVSVLTGFSRRYIKSLRMQSDAMNSTNQDVTETETGSITSMWVNDSRFLNGIGAPRALQFGSGDCTFSDLVGEATQGGDPNEYLERLVAANCVRVSDSGEVELLNRGKQVHDDLAELIGISLLPVATTVASNWGRPYVDCFAVRTAQSVKLRSSEVATTRRASKERIARFVEEADDGLCRAESDDSSETVSPEGSKLSRLGVCAFYFEILDPDSRGPASSQEQ